MKLYDNTSFTYENNKLIAEFMELPCVNPFKGKKFKQYYKVCETPAPFLKPDDITGEIYETYSEINLQYHTSWDWLMPVVEKVFVLSEDEEAWRMDIESGLTTLNIDETYRAVVEFIKQYNK
jgi:hypothetical protein